MTVTNDTADVTDDLAPPPRYRTYKRRWFGLVILMLLNIGISASTAPGLPYHMLTSA